MTGPDLVLLVGLARCGCECRGSLLALISDSRSALLDGQHDKVKPGEKTSGKPRRLEAA
jgi:hypothetical protein